MVYSRFLKESIMSHGSDINIKSRANELRKNMTDTEKYLWKILKNNQLKGCHFRRQHPYGNYILDFYCHKKNLVIELDGKIHLGQKLKDKTRTSFLESTGLKILRFNNEDIFNRINWVKKTIEEYLI